MWSSSNSCMRLCRGPGEELVHLHLDPVGAAALDEDALYPGVLVRVLDLVAARLRALVDTLMVKVAGELPLGAAPADGEVARGRRAGVEVLMPPHPGRHKH